MSDGIQEPARGREGDDVQAPCPSCVRTTAHDVVASVEDGGEEGGGINWNEWFQVIRCRGCRTHSFRRASTSSEDVFQVGEHEYDYVVTEKLYPPRASGRKDLGDHAWYLPQRVKQAYDETVQALDVGLFILAGVGLRVLIEAICQECGVSGKTLKEKTDALAEKRVTTPTSADILHKVRALGNTSAHEASPQDARQLVIAMDIVENILKDVYVFPRLAERVFVRDGARE